MPKSQRSTLVSSSPDWTTSRTVVPEEVFRLRVNGESRQVTCRGDAPLLYLLRNDLDLKSPRFGCGLGQCGACMVLIDGYPTPSCDVPVRAAQGHDVVTVEGLADDKLMKTLQGAFTDEQAAQCGYCTSGILVSACALLRNDPSPDRAAVAAALQRNLCRCGSHGRVLRAVRRAADGVRTAEDDRPTTEDGSDD